jgi:transcription-repair coupling factor (superfamily II helicase)
MTTGTNLFVRTLVQDAAFSQSATALWSGRSISIEGIAGSSCALAAAALFQKGSESMVIVTSRTEAAEQIAEDVTVFIAPEYRLNEAEYRLNGAGLNECVLLFPPMTPHDNESDSALAIADEAFGERVNVLKRLTNSVPCRYIAVVSMPALLQPVPPPELLKERTQTLSVNSRVDLESLRRFLVEGGYHSTTAVDLPGEFAVRGYILDLFAPDWEQPVRIEFLNDEIESIRRFDRTTQRSLEKITEIDLTRLQPYECAGASLLDYFLPSTPIVLVEPALFSKGND